MSTRSSCPPLVPCVKGCVVIVEEEEEGSCPPGMSHSRILQSAGATAVVYTRQRIKGILDLPEVVNTSLTVQTNASGIQESDPLLPPHELKIPVVSRVCARACVCMHVQVKERGSDDDDCFYYHSWWNSQGAVFYAHRSERL